ncbi:SDR family oxidoreductase [Streptomyces sp. NPDC005794]|uniref:SDR family oxidoreductase n=1 Tax=Streptomyces sp. NPDC005794 TaxID=3364733 RepID=UPI003690B4B9
MSDRVAGNSTIVHNGAAVGIVRDYTALRPANTDSTRDLLRLAAPRRVPVHYVSTLSVGPPRALREEFTETFLPAHQGLRYGYQQSKWAAERLVEQAAERGLPVTVHRLGRVVGPIETGTVNRQDFLWTVLRAEVPAGLVPDLFAEESWTPADRVAAEIVTAGPGTRHPAAAVHHHAGTPVRQKDLHRWLPEYDPAPAHLAGADTSGHRGCRSGPRLLRLPATGPGRGGRRPRTGDRTVGQRTQEPRGGGRPRTARPSGHRPGRLLPATGPLRRPRRPARPRRPGRRQLAGVGNSLQEPSDS